MMKIIKRLYYCFLLFEIVVFVESGVNNYKSILNLPLGEYQMIYKSIIKCNASLGNKIHQNIYFSKLTTNTSVIKGNLTYDIPFDDSLTFHMNVAMKDSTDGWKENVYVIMSRKACTTYKNLLGKQWAIYLNTFGITNQNCPIRPGVYGLTGAGYDISSGLSASSVPKSLFYGTFKSRIYFKDNRNVEHGCINIIIEVKRPRGSD